MDTAISMTLQETQFAKTYIYIYIYIYKYYERKKDVTTFPDKPVS